MLYDVATGMQRHERAERLKRSGGKSYDFQQKA